MASRSTWEKLKGFALTFPEAHEDHPWGEVAIKVRKKGFVFMGNGDPAGITVKLVNQEVHEHAMSLAGSAPTGYGLGASGWVSISIAESRQPIDIYRDFIEESYRTVAPKKLVAILDAD